MQKQQQELDASLKKIIQQQKTELATIERDCLNNKQQLMRGTQHQALSSNRHWWFNKIMVFLHFMKSKTFMTNLEQ